MALCHHYRFLQDEINSIWHKAIHQLCTKTTRPHLLDVTESEIQRAPYAFVQSPAGQIRPGKIGPAKVQPLSGQACAGALRSRTSAM